MNSAEKRLIINEFDELGVRLVKRVHIVTDMGTMVGYCSFCRIVEITH